MPVPHQRFSVRDDGDFRIDGDPDDLARARGSLAPGGWTWLRQVHGARVVVVDHPGSGAGSEADGVVSRTPGAVLAVHTADCVPVLLVDGANGVVGAAHAGWRGLLEGVVGETVAAMRGLGASRIVATVGPHIRARCYEFAGDPLDLVAGRLGDHVRATTGWGTPALDLTAATIGALDAVGVDTVVVAGCTACEPDRYFSHRARAETGRHAAAVWLEP